MKLPWKRDMVNHPPHYTAHVSGIEVIEITEHCNFCIGNALKYVLRAEHKGKRREDLSKALWYVNREITYRESQPLLECPMTEDAKGLFSIFIGYEQVGRRRDIIRALWDAQCDRTDTSNLRIAAALLKMESKR